MILYGNIFAKFFKFLNITQIEIMEIFSLLNNKCK